MRNGMSLKEVSDALDRHDRLVEALRDEHVKRIDLEESVRNAYDRIWRTRATYLRIANDKTDAISIQDRLEFKHRARGLHEALSILEPLLS